MTITAKFRSACKACGKVINKGESIDWTPGTKGAYHVTCATMLDKGIDPAAKEKSYAKAGSSYTRFSSGAEVYTNRRGRCEDAPCCGCCS